MSELAIKGAAEICKAVGQNSKEIKRLVDEKGLPAFKVDNRGSWIALPDDLAKWLRAQRDHALGPAGS